MSEVNKGSVINSIFLRVEIIHNSGTWVTQPRVYFTVQKDPGNQLGAAYPATVGISTIKKFVFHQEMAMVTGIAADDNSFPRTMFLGVIKVPQRYRRMGEKDRIEINFALPLAATTGTVSVCIQAIYKEYF